MTDKAPERIWVSPTHRPSSPHDLWVHEPPHDGRGTEYVRADLLEAARAEALEEAALEMESDTNLRTLLCCSGHECGCHGASVGEYAAFMIRALKEKPNG